MSIQQLTEEVHNSCRLLGDSSLSDNSLRGKRKRHPRVSPVAKGRAVRKLSPRLKKRKLSPAQVKLILKNYRKLYNKVKAAKRSRQSRRSPKARRSRQSRGSPKARSSRRVSPKVKKINAKYVKKIKPLLARLQRQLKAEGPRAKSPKAKRK